MNHPLFGTPFAYQEEELEMANAASSSVWHLSKCQSSLLMEVKCFDGNISFWKRKIYDRKNDGLVSILNYNKIKTLSSQNS